MDDKQIIDLFFARAEEAISEVSAKYGRLCRCIADNILSSREDSEECVNDTWFGLWRAIPPQRPGKLSVFAGRVTRNLALKKYEYLSAAKRTAEAVCSLEELGECVSGGNYVENELENRRIEAAIDDFLWSQGEEKRSVFLLRYWYFDSIDTICQKTGYSRSKVKSMLFQLRQKLRAYLEKEGITI